VVGGVYLRDILCKVVIVQFIDSCSELIACIVVVCTVIWRMLFLHAALGFILSATRCLIVEGILFVGT
jgi:hypothetical protein